METPHMLLESSLVRAFTKNLLVETSTSHKWWKKEKMPRLVKSAQSQAMPQDALDAETKHFTWKMKKSDLYIY